ncbi:hypothetical protein SAMN04487917_101363 [Arthrobacter sp. yr096]|uniref:hypothetical protein n=1 Tax=Arthrobacter sp. yr096 TaxID=1761750 RepID=UPI0008D80C32|nr:hypothetical protein [Arthrobacter sp. yr096]SEI45132.1 hypothetical protein SAMN04487917_101363 [Arthrobacter sp. yr096]
MTTPARFRKKPVVIEAIQFDGTNQPEIRDWVGLRYEGDPFKRDGFIPVDEQWVDPPADVSALVWDKLHDTWVGVKDGQWIIRGIQGEFYPCDADVFAATYDPEVAQ